MMPVCIPSPRSSTSYNGCRNQPVGQVKARNENSGGTVLRRRGDSFFCDVSVNPTAVSDCIAGCHYRCYTSLAAGFAFAIHLHSLPHTLQHLTVARSIPPLSPFAVVLHNSYSSCFQCRLLALIGKRSPITPAVLLLYAWK